MGFRWDAVENRAVSFLFALFIINEMIPSSEPQLEPQCVNTVKVVPKQPLVPDKAQVFIQPESCCIADFSLKNNLEYK